MKPVVKIAFSDFWGGFDPDDSYFTHLLSPHFELARVAEPDFLIYSCFGRRHLRFRGVKIFYTGENVRPDFSECDYAFTFDHLVRPDHYRLPLYAAYGDPRLLVKGPSTPSGSWRRKPASATSSIRTPIAKRGSSFSTSCRSINESTQAGGS
jgi:hypothetical protein